MKRAIFISIIFCASLGASAQCLFDRNIDSIRFSGGNKVVALNNNSWLLAGWVYNCPEYLIAKINCDKTALWFNLLPGWCTDLVVNNGLIYSAGDFTGEDDVTDTWGGAVALYDTSGNLLKYHVFITDSDEFYVDSNITYGATWCTLSNNQIALIDSNNVLMASGKYLASINVSNWGVNWYKQYNCNINGLIILTPYAYLATDSGLMKIDSSGSILHQNSSILPVTVCLGFQNGKLFFAGATNVFEADSALNITSSYELSKTFNKWSSLDCYKDSTFICGESASNDSISIAVFDTSGQCNMPVDIAATDSSIFVASNDSITILDSMPSLNFSYNWPTLYYRNYNKNGKSNLSNSNMTFGTINTRTDSSYLEDSISTPNGPVYLYQGYSTVSFPVYNLSSDTVKRFILTSNIVGGINCGVGYILNNYENANIPPGDSMQITDQELPFYDEEGEGYPGGFYIISSINGARPPDCDLPTLTIPAITGIANPSLPSLKIFPNPTDGIVNIQSTPTVNSIFLLTDINGRILMEKNLTQPNEQLNISALAQGMYIYTIRNGNQLPVTGKLVKQ